MTLTSVCHEGCSALPREMLLDLVCHEEHPALPREMVVGRLTLQAFCNATMRRRDDGAQLWLQVNITP
jgi:hypothetical protein